MKQSPEVERWDSLSQRFRSFVISVTARMLNWNSEHVRCDRLRWWIEDRLQAVFSLSYAGSDEELQSVYDNEIPPKHMSARQRALLDLPRDQYGAECIDCGWAGQLSEAVNDDCPVCGHAVWLDPYYAPPAEEAP